jgi:hypothetical protein
MWDQEQRVCRYVFCMAPLEQKPNENSAAFALREHCGVRCSSLSRALRLRNKKRVRRECEISCC